MEVFFYKYRKLLLFGSVFMLFYFFYEVYKGINIINNGEKGAGTGTLVDACISIFLSVYLFINVRKAIKAFNEHDSATQTSNKNNKSN